MIPKRNIKTSLDEFLAERGIDRNNFHLTEKSVLLQKIIAMKRQKKKNQDYFTYIMNNNFFNQNTKRKIFNNRLKKRTNNYNIFNNNYQKNNSIYNNYKSNFGNFHHIIKLTKKEKDKNDNLSINCNYFSDTFKNGKEKFEKDYIFHTSTKPLEVSNESILNRINRKSKDKHNSNNNSDINQYFRTSFKYPSNKFKEMIHKTENKFIYKKKLNNSKFKKKAHVSRNRIQLFFTGNNSKENSICNSIDFSIINNTTKKDMNYALSKTSQSFYILSKNETNKKSIDKNQIHKRNIKFINHFIKYCYLYYIIIIKKFFNNLKKTRIDNYSYNLSNLISNNKNSSLFEEFNEENFDRETIKNKTSENFFDGCNLSFISKNKNKRDLIYDRHKRIFNQNYQRNNLMKILNNSRIENDINIINYDIKKYSFDNEQDNNNSQMSPFFNGKSSNNNNLFKNNGGSKNSEMKDNIIGFIQVNNEINPFKIKNNNFNFFNESKNLTNEDEILSFRKKNSAHNNAKSNSIINIINTKSKDNKLTIDIKYFSNSFNKKNPNKFINTELSSDKFYFEIRNNFYNKRIKKISLRVKNSRLVKEKEDFIDLNNNDNRKKYLYSLSVIKEEDDEKNINDSSTQKSIPLKKIEHYYNISNNSKLISKASIEKLIDGSKVINEEDIDKFLMEKSSSRYKYNNKKSQEIMVVSNFGSVMRNRINRKENAKALISGILILIEFFGNLSFEIRKKSYIKLKTNWKLYKLRSYIIRYGLKYVFKQIKKENYF